MSDLLTAVCPQSKALLPRQLLFSLSAVSAEDRHRHNVLAHRTQLPGTQAGKIGQMSLV